MNIEDGCPPSPHPSQLLLVLQRFFSGKDAIIGHPLNECIGCPITVLNSQRLIGTCVRFNDSAAAAG